MSDFAFHGLEEIFKNFTKKKNEKEVSSKKKSIVKSIKWFVGIFAAIFAIEAIVYLFILPSMQTATVIWSGSEKFTIGDLSKTIYPLANKSWANFDEIEAQRLLMNISGIEDVQVVKRFPDKVYINVIERKPVAMTFVNDGDRTVPIQIDKNGILFTIRSSQTRSEHIDRSVPLISGIPVESTSNGMRIPSKYRGLLEQIAEIKSLEQNYFAAVSEIHIVPKEYGNYELVLYPVHSQTRILTGRQLTEEALQYMMVALDVVNAIEPNVAEIDLRYGSIAYRTRRSTGDSF